MRQSCKDLSQSYRCFYELYDNLLVKLIINAPIPRRGKYNYFINCFIYFIIILELQKLYHMKKSSKDFYPSYRYHYELHYNMLITFIINLPQSNSIPRRGQQNFLIKTTKNLRSYRRSSVKKGLAKVCDRVIVIILICHTIILIRITCHSNYTGTVLQYAPHKTQHALCRTSYKYSQQNFTEVLPLASLFQRFVPLSKATSLST